MKTVKVGLAVLLLVLLSSAAQPQGGAKWAVIVGVSDYLDNPAIPDLNFCVQDAQLLAERLAAAPEGFPSSNIRLLTDDAKDPKLLPTRDNIMAELPTWLSLAEEGDTVLVYFSGHGIEEEGKTYLLPSSARMANLALTAVPLEFLQTWLSDCKASQKFLILDACHSGGGRAAESVTDKTVKVIEEMAESVGMVTLASCDVKQRAYEWEEVGHGAFTWFLAEALSGEADRDANGELWASEVNDYVYRATRKWAAEQGLKQEPVKVDRSKGELVLAKVPPLEVSGEAVNTTVETVEGLATGTAKVMCNVEGANVLLDGVQVGTIADGTCEVHIPAAALSQQHTIRVEKEGYSPWQSQPFTVPAGRSVQMTASLTVAELPEATSTPAGATVPEQSWHTPRLTVYVWAEGPAQVYVCSREAALREAPWGRAMIDEMACVQENLVGVTEPGAPCTTRVVPGDHVVLVAGVVPGDLRGAIANYGWDGWLYRKLLFTSRLNDSSLSLVVQAYAVTVPEDEDHYLVAAFIPPVLQGVPLTFTVRGHAPEEAVFPVDRATAKQRLEASLFPEDLHDAVLDGLERGGKVIYVTGSHTITAFVATPSQVNTMVGPEQGREKTDVTTLPDSTPLEALVEEALSRQKGKAQP